MRTDAGGEDELQVDMAPLIDCVFLLLVFFLVAATLKRIDKELPIALPESSASLAVQQPDEAVAVGIDADGTFYLDGRPLPIGLLRQELQRLGEEAPWTKIRLDIDRNARFHSVMQVFDELRFERLEHVGINTRIDRLAR